MTKKFKCPYCGGNKLEQVTFNLRRISDVVGVDHISDAFICSGAKFEDMEAAHTRTFYRCGEVKCKKSFGASVTTILKHYFQEPKLLPSPKPEKFETYKIKDLKHCRHDCLSVKELIDVINFLNIALGNKFTISPGSEHPASIACTKFIKTGRPYLFEKVR